MSRCYRERITDLVILTDPSGARAAAEFTVHGEYLQAGAAMPPAHGQRYMLPAGAFFRLAGWQNRENFELLQPAILDGPGRRPLNFTRLR